MFLPSGVLYSHPLMTSLYVLQAFLTAIGLIVKTGSLNNSHMSWFLGESLWNLTQPSDPCARTVSVVSPLGYQFDNFPFLVLCPCDISCCGQCSKWLVLRVAQPVTGTAICTLQRSFDDTFACPESLWRLMSRTLSLTAATEAFANPTEVLCF